MPEWWSYRPRDLLLFSEEVYWRLFERANAELWPWPLVALALGAAIPVLARRPASRRAISAILVAALLVAGWAFLWRLYRPVNWAAGHAAVLFALEALALFWIGAVRGGLRVRTGRAAWPGWALFGYALALHPLMARAAGRPLAGAEVFGLAPDPTAIAVLGLLACAAPGWGRAVLLPVPVLWCLASAATLLTLGTWEGWLPLGAAAVGLWAVRAGRRAA